MGIPNDYLVNLREKIQTLIESSNDDKVTKFFNSTIGNHLQSVLEISHSSFNYTADRLADDLFLSSVKTYENAVELAKSLGYHIRRPVPASLKYSVIIDDPNNDLSNVEKISFEGKDFSINFNGVSLIQENTYTYYLDGVNYEGYNYLVEGSILTKNLALSRYESFNEVIIDDSTLSNYIGLNTDIDLSLYSEYYDENFKVIRDVIDEDLINDPYICFSETNSDKTLTILFGNDKIGAVGYGNFTAEYLSTSGSDANMLITKSDEVTLNSSTGLRAWDKKGNEITNTDFLLPYIRLVASTNLDGGEDYESKEEIRVNATKFYALKGSLNNDSDYEFYVKNKYNLDDINFWSDKKEVDNRVGELKDLNKVVFFADDSLDYDFAEKTNIDVKFDILNNEVSIKKDYINEDVVFNIVKNCDEIEDEFNDCLSLKTLYLTGFFKPLVLYYLNKVDYSQSSSSLVSDIIQDIDNRGIMGSMYVFLRPDILDLNLTVNYTGNPSVSFTKLEEEIKNKYDITNDIQTSVSSILDNYDMVNKYINYNFINTSNLNDISLIEYLNNRNIRFFERKILNLINDKYDNIFIYTFDETIKISEFLKLSNKYLRHVFSITESEFLVKNLLRYFVYKYRVLKSLIINNEEFEKLDIEFIDFNISNIRFVAV